MKKAQMPPAVPLVDLEQDEAGVYWFRLECGHRPRCGVKPRHPQYVSCFQCLLSSAIARSQERIESGQAQ